MKKERNMIDTACQLGRSLRVLSAIAVQRPGESREEAEDRSRLDLGMTSIVLYALIVELTIKGLWSYENGRAEPEHTHHIANIFSRLQRGTQTQIKRIYESACERYALVQSEGRQQLRQERFKVEMASLEEVLQWNANAMIHLKYDLTPRGKTVPAGAMWDGETIWILPKDNLITHQAHLATAGCGKPGFRRPRDDVSRDPDADLRPPASHRGRLRVVSVARMSLVRNQEGQSAKLRIAVGRVGPRRGRGLGGHGVGWAA